MATEYLCRIHGRFTIDVADAPNESPCPVCMHPSPWAISAPMTRVKRGEVARGKSDPRPPNVLNTEKLADGMPFDEWSKAEDKRDRDARWSANKKRVS